MNDTDRIGQSSILYTAITMGAASLFTLGLALFPSDYPTYREAPTDHRDTSSPELFASSQTTPGPCTRRLPAASLRGGFDQNGASSVPQGNTEVPQGIDQSRPENVAMNNVSGSQSTLTPVADEVQKRGTSLGPPAGESDWDRIASTDALARSLEARKAKAWQTAQTEGWSPIDIYGEDSGAELMAIEHGILYAYTTDNTEAAISTATDAAVSRNTLPLTGAGLRAGMWDQGAIRTTHQEFAGRVEIKDGSLPTSHATHSGGTMAAAGVEALARGMAPDALLESYDWSSDLAEMTAVAMATPGEPGTIQISSHAYGFISGWALGYSPPRWYGTAGDSEAANFGLYDWYAAEWDALCYNAPYYLPFKSAGNNRIDAAPGDGVTFRYYDNGWISKPYDPAEDPAADNADDGGFDTISLIGNAKNVMTVGSINDAVTGSDRDLAAAEMSLYSGWGPADDGRVKPDIVANGTLVYSTRATADDSYGLMTGTSMATPNAAGSALLLTEAYQQRFPGEYMTASMLKGLIIHTADDLGNFGPDYKFGWGLMNTAAALGHIEAHQEDPHAGRLQFRTIPEGAEQTHQFTWDGVGPIRVTICWTDPAGPWNYDLDDRSAKLIHDLDLQVVDPAGTIHEPFRLDPLHPAAPATTGKNRADNVEQVRLDTPEHEGVYRIVVRVDGALTTDDQAYALVVTGAEDSPGDEPSVSPSDNVPPDSGSATISARDHALGRYLVDRTLVVSWHGFADADSGIAGYYIGVNSDRIDDAVFTSLTSHTVSNLVLGSETKVYVWARDHAGNTSQAVILETFVLDPDGNWDGTAEPLGVDALDPPSPSVSTVPAPEMEMGLANGNPLLRWRYQPGVSYTIEFCTEISAETDWFRAAQERFNLDGNWVVWAQDLLHEEPDRVGFYRVVAETIDGGAIPDGDAPEE